MDHRYRPKRKWQQRTRFNVTSVGSAQGMRATSVRQSPVARSAKMQLQPAHKIILLAMLLMGLVVIVLAWFFGDDFRISNIQVQNNQAIPAAQIIANSELLGEHVLFADLEAAVKRVGELSGIEAARLTCAWHSGCVILVQTAPVLAVWQSAIDVNARVWNDRMGQVQQAADNVLSKLVIRVEDGKVPSPETKLDDRVLRALQEMIALQPTTTRYTYSGQYGLILVDPRGYKVRLGVAEYDGAMRDKLDILRQLSDQLEAKNIKPRVLDVRYVNAPFYVK